MQRYVAFLRAINVGGHTVKMDRLRAVLAGLGLAEVETFIASGNAIFRAAGAPAALEARIEAGLKEALGYEVVTFLRTDAEVAAVAAYPAFPDAPEAEGRTLSVAFLKAPPAEEAARKLLALRSDVDDFHVHGREVYWLCRTRTSDSPFSGAVLERTLRAPATLRNVTTVRKLAAKYAAG